MVTVENDTVIDDIAFDGLHVSCEPDQDGLVFSHWRDLTSRRKKKKTKTFIFMEETFLK